MARGFRRHAAAAAPEGRFIASRVQDARRRGYTNRQIADAFDINERTVRKLVSGETSGKRIYSQHIAPTRNVAPGAQNLSIVRIDLVGTDASGQEVIRTVNARTPLIGGKTPTPFDVFRLPNLQSVADRESARMDIRYAGAISFPTKNVRIASIRPILKRDPRKRLVTILGTFAS